MVLGICGEGSWIVKGEYRSLEFIECRDWKENKNDIKLKQ